MRSIAAMLVVLFAGLPGHASEEAWQALRAGGVAVLIRHAEAPGVGDPPGFDLSDCGTQRNLSQRGREQARAIGAAFAARGVAVAGVLSSRWCRGLDTASLAFGAERVEPFPALDSFFADRTNARRQSAEVSAAVAAFEGPGVLVLVTHQVNITALTGGGAAQGEAFVVDSGAGGIAVLGRIRFD